MTDSLNGQDESRGFTRPVAELFAKLESVKTDLLGIAAMDDIMSGE